MARASRVSPASTRVGSYRTVSVKPAGVLQVVALDEPYYFAHAYEGEQACNWTVDQVAAAVAGFTEAMRAEWPDVIVGDIEPTPEGVAAAGLAEWMDAYASASGEPFAFLHLDPDWSRADWASMSAEVASVGESRGVPVGVIFNGGAATTDSAWLASAGGRVLAFEAAAGGDPDHVVFQSWMDKPDFALPESELSSFTALINRYFDDRPALGSSGPTSNLALGMTARALNAEGGTFPGGAVDGDADTLWTAEAGPPVGIEIDLGSEQPIGEIRLMVAQTPAGETHHLVSCLSSVGADPIVMAELAGVTSDAQVLVVDGGGVVCRLIRVFTVASESWVAWREIEIYSP